MHTWCRLGGCDLTFPADQYNEKKAAAAAAAGNRFSGAAHKADPGKSVAAAIYGKPEEEEETPAEETARRWVDAAVLNKMFIRDEHQRQLLIQEARGPAGRHRQAVKRETARMLTFGYRPSANTIDWSKAMERLNDIVDKAIGDGEAPADDKAERWYLTDRFLGVTRAVMTYSRQEAADRQKEGWSVVGVDVDDELYRDEETGEWFRKYLDGTCGRLEIGGLSHWEKELNLKARTDVFA
jgi:hypothetical protein